MSINVDELSFNTNIGSLCKMLVKYTIYTNKTATNPNLVSSRERSGEVYV